MPTKSSENLGTEQKNQTELSMTSRRAKPATEKVVTAAEADEILAEKLSSLSTKLADKVNLDAEANAEVTESVIVPEDVGYDELLADGRERIDAIDEQILELVIRRVETATTLLKAKHERRINTRDKVRQSEIYTRLSGLAVQLTDGGVNLNKHQVRELYELLIRLGVENFRQSIIDRR